MNDVFSSVTSQAEIYKKVASDSILAFWAHQESPYFRGITRMLWSLQLLAYAFRALLNQIANEGRIRVPKQFLTLWN